MHKKVILITGIISIVFLLFALVTMVKTNRYVDRIIDHVYEKVEDLYHVDSVHVTTVYKVDGSESNLYVVLGYFTVDGMTVRYEANTNTNSYLLTYEDELNNREMIDHFYNDLFDDDEVYRVWTHRWLWSSLKVVSLTIFSGTAIYTTIGYFKYKKIKHNVEVI